MRRPFALAIASVLCAPVMAGPSPAVAQEPTVVLTLLSQTPWNQPDRPLVSIRLRAENTGEEPIDDLQIGITLWPPVSTRTGFEESLSSDPADAAALLAETRPREGTLEPGRSRDFDVPIRLPIDQLSSTQSLIYPLRLDLRSGFQSLAAVRTPIVYLVRQPLYPLSLVWTFVLRAPLIMGPDSTFVSPALETSISQGGRLAAQISALAQAVDAGVGVDVVVSPLLLLQLDEMRDGYAVREGETVRRVPAGEGGSAAAAAALDRLRTIAVARNVELSSMPFAEPVLPALTSGGLARDLGVQLQRGRELVAQLLGRAPQASILRPPRSALDQASLDQLPAQGVSTLLLDPGVVPPAQNEQGFAPSPIASLAAEGGSATAIVGDPSVQELLSREGAGSDPVLGAQAVLGELAAIWLQAPGEQRAVAMTLGDGPVLPPGFFGPLARGVATAPWLTKRTVLGLLDDPDIPRNEGASQIVPASQAFTASYAEQLKQARRRVGVYRSMLVHESAEPDRLDQLLLLAESQRFVGDEPGGLAYVGRVRDAVGSVFQAVRPQVPQPITLTSSSIRNLPIQVRNASDQALRVAIRLVSPYLRTTIERSTTLPADSTRTVSMDLELSTTGRFQVVLEVVAPSGRVIGTYSVVVRSTAYNRIALLITIGAAMLALIVWSRRFVPRRTS